MNRGQAGKLVGQRVRFQPPARHSGVPLDDDWLVAALSEETITLEHVATKRIALVGLDGIHQYFTDAARTGPTQKFGFLQLHVQVDVGANGTVNVVPLPPPRVATPAPNPL